MTHRPRHSHKSPPNRDAVKTSGCDSSAGQTGHGTEDITASLSHDDLTRVAQTFHLLGDPSRLRILFQCMRGATSVGDIADSLELSQSLVSHHLRLLRSARLVKGERRAKQVFYDVSDHHVAHVLRDMAAHIVEERA